VILLSCILTLVLLAIDFASVDLIYSFSGYTRHGVGCFIAAINLTVIFLFCQIPVVKSFVEKVKRA
jgi:hypothetical protein